MLSGTVVKSFTHLSSCLAVSWLCWIGGSESVVWATSPQRSNATLFLSPTEVRFPSAKSVHLAQAAEGADSVPVPPLPTSVPQAITPNPAGITGLDPSPQANLGIGHLRPRDLSSLQDNSALVNAGWLRGVALPIYAQPGDEQPWAWLINGWLIIGQSQPLAVGKDAAFSMLRTYDNLYTFPVLESRPDGWLRFQYTSAGTAWVHVSHFQLGTVPLIWETWEDHFLATGSVKYRKHGLSQALLSRPSNNTLPRVLVGPNSLIQPLEFQGDWMRVRVTQPARACAPLPGADTEEGWMRWRNSDAPLVWHVPQGCQS